MKNIDFDRSLDILKKENSPIGEIRILELLKKESEWCSLSQKEKQ
jgi:hypothetical protein